MVQFLELAATDARSLSLLDAYFAERSATFPPAQGAYAPSYPQDAQFTPPAGVFLVVVDDGADIGCGGVRRIQRGEEGLIRFEVKHLWLRPGARGRGLGRMLLRELEGRAIGFGAQEAVLDTNASLEAAGGLYRASGYDEIGPYNVNPNATQWYRKRL
jgi:GNAT superfamily N-acetyltransferase